ncbi:hypothetical protein M422DRAFT_242500 [Sphaerobolus stellatus SS14]|nr:hypothetical protein M422DRAFT_242500 [Sphaerobolus stellatus SS14]
MAEYGLKYGLALFDLGPPTDVCIDPGCSKFNRPLGEPSRHEAVLFTKDNGMCSKFRAWMPTRKAEPDPRQLRDID